LAAFISEEKISEIQHAVDIVEVIAEVVTLKKTGGNLVGLCPFHSEKTPSFTVSPGKQIFYCFGCGSGGNVFSFVRKHEGLSFVEAVKSVARRCGIEISDHSLTPQQRLAIRERELLFDVNRDALGFFRNCLNGDSGQIARNYLAKRRISETIIEQFQIGYAPSGWSQLADFLKTKGYDSRIAEKAGLLIPRKSGNGHYDRFRDRIVFPICDIQKRIVGFGGRVLCNELPKYLNSPETPIFNKGRNLYGLQLTKTKCRETESAFLVEGYFDLIALFQHGIENVVATLGTSLTPEHVRVLKGYVRQVVLVFDSDEAGIKAAQRSIGRFMAEGLDARIMLLPKPHDPDSYVFEFGPEAFFSLADNSKQIMAFLIDEAVRRNGLSVEGKVRITEELKPILAAVEDQVARSLYIQELSERIGVDPAAILDKVRHMSSAGHAGSFPPGTDRTTATTGVSEPSVNSGSAVDDTIPKQHRAEEKIIAMMLQFPECIPDVLSHGVIEFFENETLVRIGRKILSLFERSKVGCTDISGCLPDFEDQKLVAALALKTDQWNRKGCIKLILKYLGDCYNQKKIRLLEQIKLAEKNQDQDRLFQLLREKQMMAIECEKQKMAILE
jgi:DNA primase